jgi:hypothetical protein
MGTDPRHSRQWAGVSVWTAVAIIARATGYAYRSTYQNAGEVRVRHDDPHLGPYTPRGAVIRSAMELASDVEGLRLVLESTQGDSYRVYVADDGSTVGLWRREVRTLTETARR